MLSATDMPSMTLDDALATAEELRTWCQTEPSMSEYQPSATSALEVCVSATAHTGKNVSSLAVHAVKRTAALIQDGVGIPLSPERREGLDRFESTLDMIRRHIESLPQSGSKSQRVFSGLRFSRKCAHLKAELDRAYKALLEHLKKSPTLSSASRHESMLEIASLSTRFAGIACDVPVLNVLKPVLGMAALMCETAKTVNSNGAAATALAARARDVTNYVLDRAIELHADGQPTQEAFSTLKLTLEDIQAFLKVLQNRRKRAGSWLLAVKDKERFAELNSALDGALAVFSTNENVGTARLVRSNTQQLIALAVTVDRVEKDLKRNMTRGHSNITSAVQAPISEAQTHAGRITAFVPISFHQSHVSLFFF
ncbi:hypothetical protein B0H13DRAFT_2029438 [Mycena leptocephala]|nr:hypothetical protein B0H13DRAFT_2029438 [Mycena leptocephala]